MMKPQKKHILAAAVLLALALWTAWQNTALECNAFFLTSPKLPEAFHGYRIAHISDLHNSQMGPGNEKLLSMLKETQPDLIAITGDLIDSRNTDIEVALQFAAGAAKIAPCYYVSGNHEARVSQYGQLRDGLISLGVTVLEEESVQLTRSGETIALLGVSDPSFQTDYLFGDAQTVMTRKLQELASGDDSYTILLSHRPELFEVYASFGTDLVLSGHAHGGQFRLPFLGGLIAPNQGFFPKYDAGLYTQGNTSMVVSRGIGNSLFPFRFNNPPEVVMIELRTQPQ